MIPRTVAQWTEILACLRVEHGSKLTPEIVAARILGDFLGYEHPVGGTIAVRTRRQSRKTHDIAELANAIRAVCATMQDAATAGLVNDAANIGVTIGPTTAGKPTWYGHYRVGEGVVAWHSVRNNAGNRIAYATKEAAEAGAKLKLAEAAHSHALDVAIPGRA